MSPVDRYVMLTHALDHAAQQEAWDELPALFQARADALEEADGLAPNSVPADVVRQVHALDAALQDRLTNQLAALSGDLVTHYRQARGHQTYRRAA